MLPIQVLNHSGDDSVQHEAYSPSLTYLQGFVTTNASPETAGRAVLQTEGALDETIAARTKDYQSGFAPDNSRSLV